MALMGTARDIGRQVMKKRSLGQQGKNWGFNQNFENVNGSLTGVSNQQPLMGTATAKSQEYDFQPNTLSGVTQDTTTGGLPVSQPIGTPPTQPVGPQGGLPTSQPTTGTATQGNTNNYGNTTPTSTAGNVPNTARIPGIAGPVGQQRVDDQFQWLLDALNARNRVELGGENVGGNNINADGSYSIPDWLKGSGLMAEWNSGANTNATTRQVQTDETVAGQLAKDSLRSSDLNRLAMQDAREGAAASGFLGGSSAAEGAALRASRQTMLPVAQQDAATYGATAQANMDAVNRDALSDQDLRSGLLGQGQQIQAQLYENASDRRWKSKEANHERLWNSFENNLSWLRNSTDREDQQNFAIGDREDQQDWNSWQSGLQRDFQASQAGLDRAFQGDQAGLNRAHERQSQFFSAMFGREGTMASILASIYGNDQMTPAQQQAAAANAREIMGQLWTSFNSTLAAGVPNIFGGGTNGGLPPQGTTPTNPQQPGTQQPPATIPGAVVLDSRPSGGYVRDASGNWPTPVIGNSNGTPVYAIPGGTDPQTGLPIFFMHDGRTRIQYP